MILIYKIDLHFFKIKKNDKFINGSLHENLILRSFHM